MDAERGVMEEQIVVSENEASDGGVDATEEAILLELTHRIINMDLDDLRVIHAITTTDLGVAADVRRVARARAEQRVVDDPESGYAGLKNETERARLLVVRVADDDECRTAVEGERACALKIGLTEAVIATREDERRETQMAQRERELAIREREIEIREREHALELKCHELSVRAQEQQERMEKLIHRDQEEAALMHLASSGSVGRG